MVVSLNFELISTIKKTITLPINPTTEAREKVKSKPRKITTKSGNLANRSIEEFDCKKNTSQKLNI